METNRKMVAAVAAVMDYIRTEEDVLTAGALRPAAASKPPAPQASAWAVSGRESMMQLRGLMQLRTFHGSRLR